MTSKPGACPNLGIRLWVESECCESVSGVKWGDSINGFFRELREPVITMLREKTQVAKTARSSVSMRDTGAELFVVAWKHL